MPMISFYKELFSVDHWQAKKNIIILDKNKACQEMFFIQENMKWM